LEFGAKIVKKPCKFPDPPPSLGEIPPGFRQAKAGGSTGVIAADFIVR